MKCIVLHIACFLLITAFGHAQTLSTEVSKEKIDIGEPVELILKVSSNTPLSNLKYTAKTDAIIGKIAGNKVDESQAYQDYPLEILQAFTDTFYKNKSTYYWEGRYVLTGWDSAMVVLPGESVVCYDSTYRFNTSVVLINSPTPIPTQPIYDIIELETELPTDYSNLILYCLIGLLILVGGFVLVLWKKKKKPEIKMVATSLKQETLKEINALENSKLYLSDLKEYYFKLSIIMKRCLSKQYNQKFTDKTTAEIKIELKKHDLGNETINTLAVLLNQADMVKFAKSKPVETEILTTTQKAKEIVSEIASIEIIVPQK